MPVRDPKFFAGRYELVRSIGKGGMGEVYEAIDHDTERRVAVKRMHLDGAAKTELGARFAREVMATTRITSRHVVTVHDAGTDETTGEPFMVMDYLEGEDLETLVTRLGTLPVELAVRIAAQTCDGLVAAHAENIVHRDIKPANLVLVAPTSNAARIVKILDFGIARVNAHDLELTDLTQTGSLVGSPRYMAPEQLYGTRTLDHRADVWSLGVVLYRMLAGSTPHGNTTSLAELVVSICSEPAPPLAVRAPWVPPELAELVHRALAIDVDKRLPSSRVFAEELRRWLPDGSDITDSMVVARPKTLHIDVSSISQAPSSTQIGIARGPRITAQPATVEVERRPAPAPVRPPERIPLHIPVRPIYVLSLLAVVGAAAAFMIHQSHREAPVEAPVVTDDLPADLANTNGARWFRHVRTRCNKMELDAVLRETPAPLGRDGASFAVACTALAGDLDRARKMVMKFVPERRAQAVWPTFEVVHALADKRDANTPEITATLRFVLEFWPENYMAIYHVGVAEFIAADPNARSRLTRFLELHPGNDGFSATARALLVDIAKPTHDCHVVAVDPEGTTIHGDGCR